MPVVVSDDVALQTSHGTMRRRLTQVAWFAFLWFAGVATLSVFAYAIRSVLL